MRQRGAQEPIRLGEVAAAVGRGLVAGLAGTAAMTISSAVEARLRGRPRGTAPARAAGAVLGVAPVDERGERRFNQIVHWTYGASWGAVRGLAAAAGLRPAVADIAHLGAAWGAEQLVLPATRTAPPVTHGERSDAGIDLAHHAVYAAVTGAAFRWLARR